ncbi:hypothetical protein NDU88_003470 [Pleurodeles waltl]|uniref:Uncharacterized protein n=1 Tax=Pleurodeles waltl TaxID=8319 RepID=A0AAV7LH68_PLEWA|nr:hypothetical protein NDU88_003470 [Pleurodeles waltl]
MWLPGAPITPRPHAASWSPRFVQDSPRAPHLGARKEKRLHVLSGGVYIDFKMAAAILDFPVALSLPSLLPRTQAAGRKAASGTIARPHAPLAQLLAGLWGF